MLAGAIMYFHYVVEGCVEEGELSKHHCGGDRARKSGQRMSRLLRGVGKRLEGVAGAAGSS